MWQSKEIQLALFVKQSVILLLLRPKGGEWSDAPYFYHRVPVEEQRLPPRIEELPEGKTAPIQIILVEATNGIVRGIRFVGPDREFMASLHEAIRKQAQGDNSLMVFDGVLLDLFQRYNSSNLARHAQARTSIRREKRR